MTLRLLPVQKRVSHYSDCVSAADVRAVGVSVTGIIH